MTNVVCESISSKTMWIIVNQIGKHDFSCGLVVNYLKPWRYNSNFLSYNSKFSIISPCRNRENYFLIKLIEIALTQLLLIANEIVPPCRI